MMLSLIDSRMGLEESKTLSVRALAMPTSNSHIVGMSEEQPAFIVRKAPHAAIWSAWAVLEGAATEEIFEGSSEEEAFHWIESNGPAWLEERRRKRNS